MKNYLKLVKGEKTSIQKTEEALKRLRILKKFDPQIDKKLVLISQNGWC